MLMKSADLSQLGAHHGLQRIIFEKVLKKYHLDLTMKPQMTSVRTLTLLAAVATISGFWSSGLQAQTPTQTQTQIYGSQLMTDAERVEFQTKMRSLKTDKERDALRLDQINKMNLRATEKGITLQHTPPAAGSGPRSSAGAAGGANSGLGTGQGGSPNSSDGGKGSGR
jgi:hypothetical protein